MFLNPPKRTFVMALHVLVCFSKKWYKQVFLEPQSKISLAISCISPIIQTLNISINTSCSWSLTLLHSTHEVYRCLDTEDGAFKVQRRIHLRCQVKFLTTGRVNLSSARRLEIKNHMSSVYATRSKFCYI